MAAPMLVEPTQALGEVEPLQEEVKQGLPVWFQRPVRSVEWHLMQWLAQGLLVLAPGLGLVEPLAAEASPEA
ncbi:MAG TPA: hypothetical protein VGT03_00265 [Candidatus Acidoferrales bacterium]|nr:hypothetical protein [Candidatus Acidoferrales bacterium]